MKQQEIIDLIDNSFNEYKGSNEAILNAAFYIEAEFNKAKESNTSLSDLMHLQSHFINEKWRLYNLKGKSNYVHEDMVKIIELEKSNSEKIEDKRKELIAHLKLE